MVNHEANIRLVDTHTKGNSSYNNLQKNHEKKKNILSILQLAKFVNNLECVVQPLPVYSTPITGGEVGMVVASLDTLLAKFQSDLLRILTRKTVDNS